MIKKKSNIIMTKTFRRHKILNRAILLNFSILPQSYQNLGKQWLLMMTLRYWARVCKIKARLKEGQQRSKACRMRASLFQIIPMILLVKALPINLANMSAIRSNSALHIQGSQGLFCPLTSTLLILVRKNQRFAKSTSLPLSLIPMIESVKGRKYKECQSCQIK